MNRFKRDNLTWSGKVLICLLIGLFAGQIPALACAACCTEDAKAEMGSCCCTETSCTAPPMDEVPIKMAPQSSACSCLEDSVPLSAHTQNPPAERSELKVRILQPGAPVSIQPVIDVNRDCELYSWPPGVSTPTLASIRVVVLLV